nr:hypothetical protein [Tanacetum cinerariifolium]
MLVLGYTKLSHLHDVEWIFRKSTTEGYQFLGRRLISWQCKKQTIIVTSTTKEEDPYEKKLIQVLKIHTDDNVADLLAKTFDFWNTTTSKTVNSVKQIHAIIDGKAVVISESSVRSDLLFNDEDGIAKLVWVIDPGAKKPHWGGANAQTRFETTSKKSRDPPPSEVNTSGSREDRMEHPDDLTDFVPPTPHDSPLLGGHTLASDEEVNVASVPVNVSAATPSTPPTTTTIFGDEDLTIAHTLIKLRSGKEKVKGVAFRDVKEPPRLTRSTTTLQPLPTIDPKDKARIDADHELAVRMTHEEQEKYTIEERARLVAEYFKRRKKQLAAERAEAIRNKPPIRTQVRNMMITYLKHMGKYTHQQLKHKNLEELKKLY